MCYGCWEKMGKPMIANPKTNEAAKQISEIYRIHSAGGNFHIVIDDMNLEDCHVDYCIEQSKLNPYDHDAEQIEAECKLGELFRSMSEDERASAIAIYEGWK